MTNTSPRFFAHFAAASAVSAYVIALDARDAARVVYLAEAALVDSYVDAKCDAARKVYQEADSKARNTYKTMTEACDALAFATAV